MGKEDGHSRRRFLQTVGLTTPTLFLGNLPVAAHPAQKRIKNKSHELTADLIITGGGLGGCAAALAASRRGLRVIMTEETDWIGGQLTAQAVPPDENPWIEEFGCTRTYQALRQGIRQYYRRNYPLTEQARANEFLNPGNGWVSRLCHEPRAALAVLEEMLAPYRSGKRLTVLLRHKLVDAEVDHEKIKAVQVRNLVTSSELVLRAPWYIDATETGELLPLAKVEYVTGAESKKMTGEPHAPDVAQPHNHQAFTCCFAMDYIHGEDHTIEEPSGYRFWRDYVPKLSPPWPGRLLAWEYSDPVTLKPKALATDPEQGSGLWAYRRIADKRLFQTGTYSGDITLVNWPQNDFLEGTLYGVPEDVAKRNLQGGKELSLSLLYWLQTEAPRPDGGLGWKGLRLRPDLVDTEDGIAKYPYVRESRRVLAEFTVLEQHISREFRSQQFGGSRKIAAAEFFDSVGIGYYRIDLHPSSAGDNYLDIPALPFQIPLGALIPRRVENLLPGCKNLGVTHITNGCYRLHPVEWNIGEASGLLIAFCASEKKQPRQVRNSVDLLQRFQQMLRDDGVRLRWPEDLQA